MSTELIDSASKRVPAPLLINCGYARVGLKECKNEGRSETEYHQQWTHGLNDTLLKQRGTNASKFEYVSSIVLKAFNKKWHPNAARKEYLAQFSKSKWNDLPNTSKKNHTLSFCTECRDKYYQLQQSFPLKPKFTLADQATVSLSEDAVQKDEKTLTTSIVRDLNHTFSQTFGHSFVDSVIHNCKHERIERRTKSDVKREQRILLRKCRDDVTKQMKENAALFTLAQDESLSKYQRKRLSQSFEKPPAPKRVKSHSPLSENITWNEKKVLEDLTNFPPQAKINWSKFAREHGVTNLNGGQIIKEFALKNSINVLQLEQRQHSQPRRIRSHKRKLPGGEISVPSNPPPAKIRTEWTEMLQCGRLSLGEPCSPFTLTRCIAKQGVVTNETITVSGRKLPLLTVRERLLRKQEQFMRISTQEDHSQTGNSQTSTDTRPHTDYQRRRSLALWHDHATILNHGFLMVTVHTLYDRAVHLTSKEYMSKTGKWLNVQAEVEQPEVYTLVMGGSSIKDQAAVMGDRIECLHDLKTPTLTSNGIEIEDKLQFFIGDHPAQNFERGTQVGGSYPCGACGIDACMIDDQAHALRLPTRSTKEIQTIAIAGHYGKVPGDITPFKNLKIDGLKRELGARGHKTLDKLKEDLEKDLRHELKGVQRVPSLLLLDPQQSLRSISLQKYTILPCEPLHDLKGHIDNVLEELPSILPESLKQQYSNLLQARLGAKVSGADMRATIIYVYQLLKREGVGRKILELVRTIVRVSKILYLDDEKRSPKQVLSLYNSAWMHMELCKDFFSQPKKLTRRKLFGIYLHALTSHAPLQFEIVCQKSVNTENQERLFGQARKAAETTSNRQPGNVIATILMRLQAKKEYGQTLHSVNEADSQVSRAAATIPNESRTEVTKSFLSERKHSWQAHLERISPFLVNEKEWWTETANAYEFKDADEDPDCQDGGPDVLHFSTSSLQDVIQRQQVAWKQIADTKTSLPAENIFLYNEEGDLTEAIDIETSTIRRVQTTSDTDPTNSTPDVAEDQTDPEQTISLDEHSHMNASIPDTHQEPSIAPGNVLRTKLAKALQKAIGVSEELKTFDTIRHAIKTKQHKRIRPSQIRISEHQTQKELLQTKLQVHTKELKRHIISYEQDYLTENNIMPDPDMDESYSRLLKRRNYAKWLLSV